MITAARRKLLVSDRSPEFAATIRDAATSAGLKVKFASSGREFQTVFPLFQPSLVALDLQLTDMPWYELLYWMSQGTAPPKLLLISDDGEQLIKAVKLSAAWQLSLIAALYKPFDVAELERLLVLGAEG